MVVSVARDQGAGQDSPRGLYVILIMLPGKIPIMPICPTLQHIGPCGQT